ncbi:MAG: PHA/PHB synthase family protein [Micavibrio sp.]
MDKPGTIFREIDALWQAWLARYTLGISPAGLSGAYYSWASHLAQAPGKMLEIILYPALHAQDFSRRMTCERSPACAADPRFRSESWDAWPWRVYAETFLTLEDWAKQAATGVPGLDDHEEHVASFTVRQIMDALCPANFPATNPDLFHEMLTSGGANLVQGASNAFHDLQRVASGAPASGDGQFRVGENLAVTPGKVIFRNNLIELIRYMPQTETVYREPVLIIPAWIMKYYILDLSPHNSLVRWLVEQGHTVFMVSWKNPGAEEGDLSMDDYYRLGAMAAIDEVSKAVPKTKIHMTGYCLGGTLAMITVAAMMQKGDDRLKTLTLLAAQGDFSDAGELMLFITHSEVAFLKNVMKLQGFLDTKQMAGAFQMLRSYDLIWSKIISDYMQGQRRAILDLMVWNEDATRMPYKMHSEYLDKLFLHNDFADGHFTVEGKPVSPRNIHLPVFAVSTETDHVAPWKSVYKVHTLTSSDVTFVLTSGGHNAGIVSEPGHKGRSYRIHEKEPADHYVSPNHWLETAEQREGSWWPAWHKWLVGQSSKEKIPPTPMGKTLCPAPGTYVLQK